MFILVDTVAFVKSIDAPVNHKGVTRASSDVTATRHSGIVLIEVLTLTATFNITVDHMETF